MNNVVNVVDYPHNLQRILVATNLFGRGMDIERVNIVFNYDMPEDSDTYLHRVARAGRFGTKGLAITFVSDESDAKILNEVQERFDVNISELPDEIDLSSYSKFFFFILYFLAFSAQNLKLIFWFFLQSKEDKLEQPIFFGIIDLHCNHVCFSHYWNTKIV